MSGGASALVVAVLFIGGGLLILAIAARRLPPTERSLVYRRTGWLLIGGAGMPMALFLTAELVGPFYIAAVAAFAALLARWRRFDRAISLVVSLFAALVVGATAVALVVAIVRREVAGISDSADWLAVAIALSGCAMTVAAAKLGRMFGRGVLWRARFRSDAATPTSLP